MSGKFLHFNAECVACILNRYLDKTPPNAGESEKLDYAKQVLCLIAESEEDITAPEIVAAVTRLRNGMFGFTDDYAEIKTYFNKLMLSKEQMCEKEILSSDNTFDLALKLSLYGNYIDFGALRNVDEKKLDGITAEAKGIELNKDELNRLKADLSAAEKLIYLTDNCGEIVMDKLFIKELKKLYPNLDITVLVRGAPVLNDATVKDANEVGLSSVATVLSNGTDIAGTCLKRLPEGVKAKIDSADVIISKGQGNFETLNGCNKNVYYLFLCKCKLFSNRFNVPPCTGMLLNDLRL